MKIHVIDQEFLETREAIAGFLVEAPEGPILIETGPATTQDTLERKVRDLGFEPASIQHVLVSHIHLDHSGGAGYWARRGSRVYVHPEGARHLIDPSRLLSSAARIYQDRMEQLWGETLPIPEEQVVKLPEGVHTIAGAQVEALETPGHATHHLAFRLEDVIFTGDVGACRIPGQEFVSVPAPPPEFKLELWLKSLEKLRSREPRKLYLTHFGEVGDPATHLDRLEQRLTECVDFVAQHWGEPPEQLAKRYQKWDREQAARWGVEEDDYAAYDKANPAFMSAQGISRYLRKKEEQAAQA